MPTGPRRLGSGVWASLLQHVDVARVVLYTHDMALADLLSRLDSRPEVRGREFERICAWYLRSAPEYRRRFRRVWLWSEWPRAWAPDAGIDLVAQEHGGDLWAIQAKA